jgi:cytochrome c biogenesis protein CcmG/thiol:disulfide interchange protein DsbE
MKVPIQIVLLLVMVGACTRVRPGSVNGALQPAQERKAAAGFALRDSVGEMATLEQYKGKVVLLDFWATWCTGCKKEIPWFVDLQRKFGTKQLAVVGVSLDDGGWDVVKPFLAEAHVPYRMLLGDNATAERYGIQGMPDTFLIDRQGRVAASYLAALVDKEELETNIQALLSEK